MALESKMGEKAAGEFGEQGSCLRRNICLCRNREEASKSKIDNGVACVKVIRSNERF